MTNPGTAVLRVLACLTACSALIAVTPVQPPKADAMHEAEKFARTISEIADRLRALEVPDELFTQPAFAAIYENPLPYAAAAKAMMARQDVDSHRKRIVALAMQRLPVDAFVAVAVATADSMERGQTDVKVLETFAFAPLNWGHQALLMHYDQPPVRALLLRLLNLPQLSPQRKERIRERILTGQAKLEFLDYRAMIGRPVRE